MPRFKPAPRPEDGAPVARLMSAPRFQLGDSVVVGFKRYLCDPFRRFRRGTITAIAERAVRVRFARFKLFRKRTCWIALDDPKRQVSKLEL